jgi:hypothetical protein
MGNWTARAWSSCGSVSADAGVRGYDLDQGCEAAEVGCIEGQQPRDAVLQHGCHQIGVVHLLASARMGRKQVQQPIQDVRAVLRDVERGAESVNVGNGSCHGQGRAGRLRECSAAFGRLA